MLPNAMLPLAATVVAPLSVVAPFTLNVDAL